MGGYNSLPQLQMPASPLEQAGQALQVRNQLAQGQLTQEQLRGAQMQNQQHEQEQKDQQAFRQAMQDPSMKGKTLGEIADVLAQSGHISPGGYQAAKKADIEQRKEVSGLTKVDLENRTASHAATEQLYNNVMNMPDEQLAQAWPDIAKQYDSIPGNKPILDPAKPMTKQQLADFGPVLDMHEAYLAGEVAKRTAKAEEEGKAAKSQQEQLSVTAQQLANAPDKNAYNAIFQNLPVRIAQNFPDPSKWSPEMKDSILQAGMTPHEQSTVPVEKIEMKDWLARNPGKTPADYERWKASGTTTSTDRITDQGIVTASSKSLPPVSASSPKVSSGASPRVRGGQPSQPAGESTTESLVDMIGNYKASPTILSRLMAKHPEILAKVQQKYPDWSQSQYNEANKAITDLAPSGTTGKLLTSYNTFVRHAGDMWDAIDELKNSGYQDWNKPMNWLAQHTGDPRVQAFMAKMQPVQKEFQSFLIGGHALYEDDRKDAKALFDENSSPAAMRAVLQSLAHTGGARLSEMNNSFHRATGRDIPNLVSSEAAAAYNKITGKGAKSEMPKAGDRFVIEMNGKHYKYKGSGKTDDLSNYDEQ